MDKTFLPCLEMFCMAGVPGAGGLTGPCITGWKGKFFFLSKEYMHMHTLFAFDKFKIHYKALIFFLLNNYTEIN